MKVIILILFLVTYSPSVFSQTSFNYRYTEVCSGRTNTVKVVLNNNSDFFTVFFFGENKTFSSTQFNNGEYAEWMDMVYRSWSEYYPCQEVLALVQETSKKVAERNSKEFTQPIIIISSDLAFFSPNDFRIGSGWSETDRITGKSVGGLGTIGSGRIYSFGYFRLNPVFPNTNSVENYNILLVDGNWLGNLMNGLYYNYNGSGAFIFNSMTFGDMNGFPFQNNGLLLGGFLPIYGSNQISLNSLMVFSYTYYERVFKINYWFDNAIRVNPNLTVTFQLSPTFGINVTSNMTYRFGVDSGFINYGIMTGAKLLF
jgi:hypothetical protein